MRTSRLLGTYKTSPLFWQIFRKSEILLSTVSIPTLKFPTIQIFRKELLSQPDRHLRLKINSGNYRKSQHPHCLTGGRIIESIATTSLHTITTSLLEKVKSFMLSKMTSGCTIRQVKQVSCMLGFADFKKGVFGRCY